MPGWSEQTRFTAGACREGLLQFRAFWMGLLFCLGALLLFGYQYRHDLTAQVGTWVLEDLNQRWSASGWEVRFESAELISSRQIRIRHVMLGQQGSDRAALQIDSLHLNLVDPWDRLSQGNQQPWIEQIFLDQTRVTIDWAAASEPQWRALAEQLRPATTPRHPPPEISIRNATCQIVGDLATESSVVLRQIHGQWRPQPNNAQKGLLRFESDYFQQGIIQWWVEGQRWRATAQCDELIINDDWQTWLAQIAEVDLPSETHLSGVIQTSLTASGDLNSLAETLQFRLSGEVQKMNVVHPQWDTPISEGKLKFAVHNHGWEVSEFTAKLGSGRCQVQFQHTGWELGQDFSCSGQLDNFWISTGLASLAPAPLKKFLQDFSPQGLASLHFQFGNRQGVPFRSVQAWVHDLTAVYHRFPYRLEHIVGTAELQEQAFSFDFQALQSGQIITLQGSGHNPGPDATYQVRWSCPGNLPIDEKLFDAVQDYPQIHRQLLALRIRGVFGTQGQIIRSDPLSPPQLSYEIDLQQGTVRHAAFDYPLRNVRGKLQVNGGHMQWTEIVGENLSTVVVSAGEWHPEQGLHMRFLANGVRLDEQLRRAVSPAVGLAWDQLRPSGTLPLVRADMTWHPKTEPEPRWDIWLDARQAEGASGEGSPPLKSTSSLAIRPTAFPYELSSIETLVHIERGQVTWNEFLAKHGRGWVTCTGTGDFSTPVWELQLRDIVTGAIPYDSALRDALPTGIRDSLDDLRFAGNLNVAGQMTWRGTMASPSTPIAPVEWAATIPNAQEDVSREAWQPVGYWTEAATRRGPDPAASNYLPTAAKWGQDISSNWDLQVNIDQGALVAGLPITNMHGVVHFQGAARGVEAYSQGSLHLDSCLIGDVQVTNLRGPIWIDTDRVGLGFFAVPADAPPHTQSMTGQVFGGRVQLDAQIWQEAQPRFYLQTTLNDASLKEAARSLAPSMTQIDGQGQMAVRLSGNCHSTDSWEGEGLMNLYNARIYELPVLLATLKQLRRFNEDKSAFDSSNINFGIRGSKININRLELSGEPISLIGNGQVNLDRTVDLNFYTVAGRNRFYVPLISELVQASSQQILWINVVGSLDQPRTERQILPGVNESLKELFPD